MRLIRGDPLRADGAGGISAEMNPSGNCRWRDILLDLEKLKDGA